MRKKIGLMIASAMIFVLLASIACAKLNPGHGAGVVGPGEVSSEAEATFQFTQYGFPDRVRFGTHISGYGGSANSLNVRDGLDMHTLDDGEHVRLNLGPQEKASQVGVLETRVSDADSYCEWEEHNDYEYLNCIGPYGQASSWMGDYVGPWTLMGGTATSSWVRNVQNININFPPGAPPIGIGGGMVAGAGFATMHEEITVDEDGPGGNAPTTVYAEEVEVTPPAIPEGQSGVGGLTIWGTPESFGKTDSASADADGASNGAIVENAGVEYNAYDFSGTNDGGSTTFQTSSPTGEGGGNHPTTSLSMGPSADVQQGVATLAAYDADGNPAAAVTVGNDHVTGASSVNMQSFKGGQEMASISMDPVTDGDINVYVDGGGMHSWPNAGASPIYSPTDLATAGWGVSQLQIWVCDAQAVPTAGGPNGIGCDAYVGVMPGLNQVVDAVDFAAGGTVPTSQPCSGTAHLCIGR